jgi:hypothetical protein
MRERWKNDLSAICFVLPCPAEYQKLSCVFNEKDDDGGIK